MTRIIVESTDKEIKDNERIIRHILMDALYEFVSHRGPTAEEYVNKRYPGNSVYATPEERAAKIKEVNNRIILAEKLHKAMALFEVDNNPQYLEEEE